MARYQTNDPEVNCSCGVKFSCREFIRIPATRRTVKDAPEMWDRHCPNCNGFWGAAPYPNRNEPGFE